MLLKHLLNPWFCSVAHKKSTPPPLLLVGSFFLRSDSAGRHRHFADGYCLLPRKFLSTPLERRSRRRSEVTPAEQTASHGQAPLQPKRLLTAPTESDAEKPRAKKSTPSAHPAPCVQVDAAQQENVQPMSALKASEVSPLRQDPLEEYRRDYKYKVVIRGALRKHMHGMTCPDCEKVSRNLHLALSIHHWGAALTGHVSANDAPLSSSFKLLA